MKCQRRIWSFLTLSALFVFSLAPLPAFAGNGGDENEFDLPPLPPNLEEFAPTEKGNKKIGPNSVIITLSIAELVCARQTEKSPDEIFFEVNGERVVKKAMEMKTKDKRSSIGLTQIVLGHRETTTMRVRMMEEDSTLMIFNQYVDPHDLLGEFHITFANEGGEVFSAVNYVATCKKTKKNVLCYGGGGQYSLQLKVDTKNVKPIN